MMINIIEPNSNCKMAEIEIDLSKIDATKYGDWKKLIITKLNERFKINLTINDIHKIKFGVSDDENDEPITISDDNQAVPSLTVESHVSLRLSRAGALALSIEINKQTEINCLAAIEKLNAIFTELVARKIISKHEKLIFTVDDSDIICRIICKGNFFILQALRGVFSSYSINSLVCAFREDKNNFWLSIVAQDNFENFDFKKLAVEIDTAIVAQKQIRDTENKTWKEVCVAEPVNGNMTATFSRGGVGVDRTNLTCFNKMRFTNSIEKQKEGRRKVFCIKPLNMRQVVISFTTGEIEVWDPIFNHCIKAYKPLPNAYGYFHIPLTVLPDNIVIASMKQDNDHHSTFLILIDFKPDEPKTLYSLLFPGKVYALAANPKKNTLVTCAHSNNMDMDATNDVLLVSKLDMDNKKISLNIHRTMTTQGKVLHLINSLDNNVVSATDTGHIQVWDVVKRRSIQTISTDGSPIRSLVELPNGDLAYANSRGIFASDPKTSRLRKEYDTGPLARGNSRLTVLGGRYLVAAFEQRGLCLKTWDLANDTVCDFTYDETNDCSRAFTGFNNRVLIGNRFSELSSYTIPAAEVCEAGIRNFLLDILKAQPVIDIVVGYAPNCNTLLSNLSPALSPPPPVVAFSKGGNSAAIAATYSATAAAGSQPIAQTTAILNQYRNLSTGVSEYSEERLALNSIGAKAKEEEERIVIELSKSLVSPDTGGNTASTSGADANNSTGTNIAAISAVSSNRGSQL